MRHLNTNLFFSGNKKYSKQYFLKHFHNLFLKYFYEFYSKKQKVFGIGLNKTGTSSLGAYFERLGYYHSFETYSSRKLNRFLKDENYLFKEASRFDMHEDWPWAFVYEKIFYRFSDAKFILTLRETPEKWFNSLLNTTIRHGPNPQNLIFYGSEAIKPEMKKRLIEQYNNHTKKVINFFENNNAMDKLLILKTNDIDKEEKICSFLGIQFNPKIKYPHMNKGVYK